MDAVSSIISKDWVGLILLPGISSVAGFYFMLFYVTSLNLTLQIECLSAVKVSVKDELTLSVSVAVGSTIVGACVQLSIDISLYIL
jgi:Ca2+:H+ antiporter